MPIFEFECEECNFGWEDICTLSELPTVCPECQTENRVKKLISLPAPGKVELSGRELKDKLKIDTQKLKADAGKNENLLANLVGESKYEGNLKLEKQIKQIRPKIKTSKKSQRS